MISIKHINKARDIISNTWEKLLNKKKEHKQWNITEIKYMLFMLLTYRNVDHLIELSTYTEEQLKNCCLNNIISDYEYKNNLINLNVNLAITLFNCKFIPKFAVCTNIIKSYGKNKNLYDDMINNVLSKILFISFPNKDNVQGLVIANCLKAVLSEKVDYLENSSILIKKYKLYFMIESLKTDIISYAYDKEMYDFYISIL